MATRGRPLKFESPEELLKKAEEYFLSLQDDAYRYVPAYDKNGKELYNRGKWVAVLDRHGNIQKEWKKRPTITGLALYLDTSRETLMNYQAREEFFDAVKKVKDMIENYYEEIDYNPALKIFSLKQFGWTDKQEIESTNKNVNIELSNMEDEQLDKEIAKHKKWLKKLLEED